MLQNKYFITLRPLTPFFFGGENTFGEGEEANFFVRSNYLPQQTTLLGFLRYELLQQNKLLGTDPAATKWAELIGPASFGRKNDEFTGNFGAIKKLSPVFLSNSKQHFICQSFDWGTAESINSEGAIEERLYPLEFSVSAEGNCITAEKENKIPVLKAGNTDFTQKNGIKSLWVNTDGKVKKQWDYENEFPSGKGYDNGFFIAGQQVGIHRKTKRTKEDTGDFYKIVSYQLADDFAFAFFATIELPSDKKFASRIVTMGGERSVFSMTVTPAETSFEELFTPSTYNEGRSDSRKAIVLTSEAYVTDDILSKCRFAITETVPFRNITTTQQQKGNYARISGGAVLKTEELLYLLKRGSILYTDDTNSIKPSFTNPSFQTIGYNHFIEL